MEQAKATQQQVEDVELVDLWRHEEQRSLVDLVRGGHVLDQLEHRVPKDDGAGGQGQVLAHLEL